MLAQLHLQQQLKEVEMQQRHEAELSKIVRSKQKFHEGSPRFLREALRRLSQSHAVGAAPVRFSQAEPEHQGDRRHQQHHDQQCEGGAVAFAQEVEYKRHKRQSGGVFVAILTQVFCFQMVSVAS